MKKEVFAALAFLIITSSSCTTFGPGLFNKQTLHEQYGKKLESAGLTNTTLGRQWFTAAAKALERPVTITLPYEEVGYFAADAPRAVGLQFSATRGAKLQVTISRTPDSLRLFADVWKAVTGRSPKHVTSLDTAQSAFELEVDDNTTYVLRLQPELLNSGEYRLSISVGPSLGFPVSSKTGRIGSIWGDSRDAGARNHEGIDIFAPRGTPVVAAYDGTVTRVNENNLGGKVVWMRPKGKALSLYYAHLDSQVAQAGQAVKRGDTLGLVGNTGNARTTPPHLHFGIYAMGGAIDPLPFVNPQIKTPREVSGSMGVLKSSARVSTSINRDGQRISANTVVWPLARTSIGFRVLTPNGSTAVISSSELKENPLRQGKVKDSSNLYEKPLLGAARKTGLEKGTTVTVIGTYDTFSYVRWQSLEGWLPTTALQ